MKEQNFDEAESKLKVLYVSAQTADPELSTRALFELGQINERKGLWVQALAQFKECELKKKDLASFKAELELPARLAGLYATMGELQTSEKYAKQAEYNLQVYIQQINFNNQKAWWAETFYHMGSFPVQFMTEENWNNFAQRFHSTSQYLIRSMEFSDPVWSERSFLLTQEFFKKSFELLTVTHSDSEENGVLAASAIKERINLLEEILQKIELYKPINLDNSHTVSAFYQTLDDYKMRVKSILYEL